MEILIDDTFPFANYQMKCFDIRTLIAFLSSTYVRPCDLVYMDGPVANLLGIFPISNANAMSLVSVESVPINVC
jgi:hypothetical protein